MNERILVVDDEPDIRLLLKDILEDEGFEVQLAEDANAARQLKASLAPDLILLDIWMPGLDGVSLLKEWSANNQVECPVVMMSGHGTVETAVEATRFGAVAFIEKPLTIAKLLSTVKSALTDRQLPMTSQVLAPVEEPVGNSPVMQALRQLANNLKDGHQPVYISGRDAGSCRIWAAYLCQHSGQPEVYNSSQQLEKIFPLTNNLYIDEIADISGEQQLFLYEAIQRNPSQSRFRVLVASRLDWTELRQLPNQDPRLIACWENALRIPSLNEHIEDVPELVNYYVDWFSQTDGLGYRHFGVAAQNLLRNHDWVGGIDQFKHFIRQMLMASDVETIAAAPFAAV